MPNETSFAPSMSAQAVPWRIEEGVNRFRLHTPLAPSYMQHFKEPGGRGNLTPTSTLHEGKRWQEEPEVVWRYLVRILHVHSSRGPAEECCERT